MFFFKITPFVSKFTVITDRECKQKLKRGEVAQYGRWLRFLSESYQGLDDRRGAGVENTGGQNRRKYGWANSGNGWGSDGPSWRKSGQNRPSDGSGGRKGGKDAEDASPLKTAPNVQKDPSRNSEEGNRKLLSLEDKSVGEVGAYASRDHQVQQENNKEKSDLINENKEKGIQVFEMAEKSTTSDGGRVKAKEAVVIAVRERSERVDEEEVEDVSGDGKKGGEVKRKRESGCYRKIARESKGDKSEPMDMEKKRAADGMEVDEEQTPKKSRVERTTEVQQESNKANEKAGLSEQPRGTQ